MEELLICDLPWMLDPAERESRLFRHVNALWPQSGSLARLYALGIDAYQLWLNRQELMTNPEFALRGKTGTLSLEGGNRIRRQLDWAQFIDGIPVALPKSTLTQDTDVSENADG